MEINIVKFIARSGYCSRRQAESLVRAGQVTVNQRPAKLGEVIAEETDEVRVGSRLIQRQEEKKYIFLNKPAGYTCTRRKFKNEKNIFELIDDDTVFVVGRLDKNSRGLVLLTNDGDLAYRLTHPRFEHEKNYELQITNYELVNGEDVCGKLITGVEIGDGDGVVRAKEAEYLGEGKFRVVLTEGKKRQLRRMFGRLGLSVVDLKRTMIGPLVLGDLAEGKWRRLTAREETRLK